MPREVVRESSTANATQDARRDAEPHISLAHRLAARRFYRSAPPYCTQFEDDGSVTLRRKTYEYWEQREPEEATTWEIISRHDDLEEAERRLRFIVSSPVYYDAEGRPVRSPNRSRARWPMPPTDGE